MKLATIGVCYYPEHWPRETWAAQAQTMAAGGIEQVRLAEFAWSRIEPEPDRFAWEWLDEAVETLAGAGLQLILCTPTACPPRWLIDRYPDILPVDERGQVRDFGSRRHYRFACAHYRSEATRISRAVIDRYAAHPAVVGWQLDNEYGCHATTRSYAAADLRAFQAWLEARYGHIDALNDAWGTVFWSQEYRAFGEVGLPNLTVTEANPAHRFAYYHFASDQVVSFNRDQVGLVRASEGADRWITHNFMGNFTDFDHFDVAADLDIATWDSYPLGFLDQAWFTEDEKLRYRRIGHPDWAAFHHDLYRAVGRGRFGVMEQQPGPVNWAGANAAPLARAPAYWAMEAVAHGAELVSYFRYQQLPRAQEQMHAALRRPDGEAAPAWSCLEQVRRALDELPAATTLPASIALLFDYHSCWATEIQPHTPGAAHLEWAFHFYSAARAMGLDLDLVGPEQVLAGYRVLIIPGSVFVDDDLVDRVEQAGLRCLIGPRSASREPKFALPVELPPGPLQRLLPLRVVAVDGLRPGASRTFRYTDADRVREKPSDEDTNRFSDAVVTRWYEILETGLTPRLRDTTGDGLWYTHDGHHYVNGFPTAELIQEVLREMLATSEVAVQNLPEGLRLRRRGALTFVFNASPEARRYELPDATLLLGSAELAQGAYAVWSAGP